MLDALVQNGGPQAISRELGVDEQTAHKGMAALLPAVLGGMQNHAQATPQGIGGLADVLGGLGGGGLMSNVLAPEPTNVSQGNQVLGQLFGGKDTSRAVAQHASQQTGIEPSLLKKMLPIVAMLAAGYFAKQAQGQGSGANPLGGGMGGILGSLLGGGSGAGGNVLGSILGGLAGSRR
jgi:hypothetical protein